MLRPHLFGALAILLPALAQGPDPITNVPKLLQNLNRDGFEVLQGQFKILDPVKYVCGGLTPGSEPLIPSTFYNNVQPYITTVLPGAYDDPNPAHRWEQIKRPLFVSFMLRQDEAVLLVGSTPPPMAYFSFQTFLFFRHNPNTNNEDPATGGFFRPYEGTFSALGDNVNYLTVNTTGATPFNRPIAFISTGNRQTQERIRSALRTSGYPDAIINTETLTPSLLRFGYNTGDHFLFLWRSALAVGGPAAMSAYQQKVEDPLLSPVRIFRVRPKTEFPADPLPAPVLRVKGTGRSEIDLFPTMQALRQAILNRFDADYNAQELDSFLPDSFPEGYPAIQRARAYLGPGKEGSAGYSRDSNFYMSDWFDLGENDFAIVYGVNHAATGKVTYSSAAVYLDRTYNVGVADATTTDFAVTPRIADLYPPSAPGIDKFYVWKVARNCNGEKACLEAKIDPAHADVCGARIPVTSPVRIGFRQYAEPATRVGPADAEMLYDRVIVFRRK